MVLNGPALFHGRGAEWPVLSTATVLNGPGAVHSHGAERPGAVHGHGAEHGLPLPSETPLSGCLKVASTALIWPELCREE